jgi:hypothetical protein
MHVKTHHVMLIALGGMLGGVSLASGVHQPTPTEAAVAAPEGLTDPMFECYEDGSCIAYVPGHAPVFFSRLIENYDYWRS